MRYSLRKLGGNALEDITAGDLEQLKAEIFAMPISQVTMYNKIGALRAVLNWRHNKGLCETIKFPAVPRGSQKKFVPPTPEELTRLYAAASPYIQRVIVLGSQTGARMGECELLRLTWEDVDLNQRVLRIHGSKKNPNSPWREAPIKKELEQLFTNWKKSDLETGAEYLVNNKGKPVKSIKRAWKNALEKAGIMRRIRPYDLRHAFGTELVTAGVDIGTVAKLMGHANPAMFLTHYQYVMDKQKRKAVEALPDIDFG